MEIIIGQEVLCPDGLGRVSHYDSTLIWIQLYIGNSTISDFRTVKYNIETVEFINPRNGTNEIYYDKKDCTNDIFKENILLNKKEIETLKTASFLLMKDVEGCENWIEGIGDCGKCKACRISKCADEIDDLIYPNI